MVTLKNEYLQVEINELGAELTSVRSLENDLEYIWRADKKIWGETCTNSVSNRWSLKGRSLRI